MLARLQGILARFGKPAQVAAPTHRLSCLEQEILLLRQGDGAGLEQYFDERSREDATNRDADTSSNLSDRADGTEDTKDR